MIGAVVFCGRGRVLHWGWRGLRVMVLFGFRDGATGVNFGVGGRRRVRGFEGRVGDAVGLNGVLLAGSL